ncbi:MAG: UbiA family prenyltransferase [Rhodothermales bacterium]
MTHPADTAARPHALTSLLLYGNLQIPLVAAGLLGATPLWFDAPLQGPLMLAGAGGAFLLYQIDRAWHTSAEDAHNQPDRLQWVHRHRRYTLFSTLASLLAIGVAWPYLSPRTLGAGAVLGVAGVLYLFPLLPGKTRLKGNWLIKPLAIAGGWALGATLLPTLEAGRLPDGQVALLFVYRLLFLLPNVLLADWPDRDGDRREGLRSVAQFLGETSMRRVAQLTCGAALAVGGVLAWRSGWPPPAWIDLAGPVIMALLVSRPMPASRWFYTLALDLAAAWPLVGVAIAGWGR